jgi:hypothetical protein
MHGKPLSFLPGILEIGLCETQMPKPHVGHCAARGTYISGIQRSYENDFDIV